MARACSLFGPEITEVKWDSSETLTYRESATLSVTLASGKIIHGDRDAVLDASGPLRVIHKTRTSQADGTTVVRFEVVPLKVGKNLEATIRYGKENGASRSIRFDVAMPSLAGHSNGSFLEMVSAPDSSVYGSHITEWSDLTDTVYISGHAASNVCRKVSAAVIDYAISHARIDDAFFVGAGFASMPEDPDATSTSLAKIKALGLPPDIDKAIAQIDRSQNATAAAMLAGAIDDPASFHKPSDKGQAFAAALGLYGHRKGDNSFMLDRKTIGAHTPELIGWVGSPESAIALWQDMQGIDLNFPMQAIEQMPPGQRATLASYLRQYAETLNGRVLLDHEIEKVRDSSGLVRQNRSNTPEQGRTVAALKRWSIQARPGQESPLGAISSMSDSDSGQDGIAFLPFIDTATHQELSFTLAKSMVDPDQKASPDKGKPLLELLGESVTREMVVSLREAAKRQDERRSEAIDALSRIAEEMQNEKNKGAWLATEHTLKVSKVDDLGNIIGIDDVTWNNASRWLRQVEFADFMRRESQSFRQSAQRIEDQSKDPKAVAINNYTLLDSFIRGWDLSFLDNAKQSPYRQWMESRRDGVWEEIFKQAEARHIDLSNVLSEQIVFQVREAGDQYVIKPMYVGDYWQTSVVMSEDSPLIYYRTPWMQRDIVYLKPQAVEQDVWKSASHVFRKDDPTASLQLLAKPMLDAALAEQDAGKRQKGIFNALVVAPAYTANRLISDYWDLWKVGDEEKAEEEEFEAGLSNPDSDAGSALKKIIADGSPSDVDRLKEYLKVRTFEGGLKILACVSEAIDALERSDGKASPGIVNDCFSKDSPTERVAIVNLGLNVPLASIQKTLDEQAARWQQDALGRTFAEHDLLDAANSIARLLLSPQSEQDLAHISKRGMEAYIRLLWYSGEYKKALDTSRVAVLAHTSSPIAVQRAVILDMAQLELLKALVYSGAKLGIAGAPVFNTASLSGESKQPHAVFFKLPVNDYAVWPPAVDRIAYQVRTVSVKYEVPTGNTRAPTYEQFHSVSTYAQGDVQRSELSIGRAIEKDGNPTALPMRTSGGLRKTILTRQGGSVQSLSYADVIDDQGHSVVTKIAVTQDLPPDQLISLLRSKGFEMLQMKKLSEEYGRPVVLVYPDHAVVVTGKQAIDFQLPGGTDTYADLVRTALQEKGIGHTVIADEDGLLHEVRYIMDNKIDAAAYFDSMQPYPGVLAWSRDGSAIRVLTREPNGTNASWAIENGQMTKLSTGPAAVKDLQDFENASIARRSDDKFKLMNVSAFDMESADSISVQFGKTKAEIPSVEFAALLGGFPLPTPHLDALFPEVANGAAAPTVVIVRDALTNGVARTGGGGGGIIKPPPPFPDVTPDPDDPRSFWGYLVKTGGTGKRSASSWDALAAAIPVDTDRDFSMPAYGPDTAHIPPMELLRALREKYPDYRFLLDDEPDVAREHAINPVLVTSANDVAAYIPEKSFKVTDSDTIKATRSLLQSAGVKVEDSVKKLSQKNVIVLSGHKNQQFINYIDVHIKGGTLKDKVVVLFSCYEPGDANIAHRVINEGGAREVIFFNQTIDATAVKQVLRELATQLQQQPSDGGKPMLDVLDKSMKSVIDDPSTDPEDAMKVEVLYRGRTPQISAITPKLSNQIG
jgi:hypothetical protein